MPRVFYIVGPTAGGKSELAADAAVRLNAEIVNADAFQIYGGFDVLSAKPSATALGKAPHHLIGVVSPSDEMSAAKYRELALPVIADIIARGKTPLVVGGTGLYVKALTHGLDNTPPSDPALRKELDKLATGQLRSRLTALDPRARETVDMKNRRRVIRAIEIAELTGRPASHQRTRWTKTLNAHLPRSGDVPVAEPTVDRRPRGRRSLIGENGTWQPTGVFVFRDREELYWRINKRVEAMFKQGAIDEVRDAGELSRTASQMIGVSAIREYLAGRVSLAQCAARIQQATRRYAKRQLTWFRHQSNFEALNLSLLTHNEAVEWVSRRALAPRLVND